MDRNQTVFTTTTRGWFLDGATHLTLASTLLVLVPIVTVIIWYCIDYLGSPLRKYPGPALGAWTNFYRMYHAYRGQLHLVSKQLHDKYGPVVRMGPNYLDVDYPSLIKVCFDTSGTWRKTEWHAVSGVLVDGELFFNIFSEIRPAEHARMKKPIAKYFTQNGIAPLEPHVDSVLGSLCKTMSEKFAGDGRFGEPFDFGEWIQFYTWDVMAKTTWSRRVGYLEKGYDFDGSLKVSEKAMDYLSAVGMNPKLDRLLEKNPIIRIGPPTFGAIADLGRSHLMARINGEDGHDAAKPDFLDFYLEAQRQHPDVVDVYRILSYMLVNLAAGTDTAAISLRSVLYLSLKHPRVYARLEDEILAAPLSRLPAPYAEARRLPYLEAVMRECLRYLPGNCFALERYVPRGGLAMPDGSHVPEGTAVGFNAYVINRNEVNGVWGPDAGEFRPERWMRADGEAEDAFRARLQAMNAADLTFSAGSRKCLGINIGKVEVTKTVATLVRLFRFELAHPDQDWSIHNSIFPRQSGVIFKVMQRHGAGVDIQDMDLSY